MKNKELMEVYKALTGMNYAGVKFGYFVAKNISIIGSEIDSIQKAIEPYKEYTEYDKERVKLAVKYSKKDENGKPVIENNVYQIEDQKAFEEVVNKLREEKKETIEKRNHQIDEYGKLLEEETKITLYKIKEENLPADIKTQDMRAIFNLIEE